MIGKLLGKSVVKLVAEVVKAPVETFEAVVQAVGEELDPKRPKK